jgi:hypothetical protein
VGSEEVSGCQEGDEMGSVDLIDCQEGRKKISNFQMGKEENMGLEMSSYQQEEMMEKEDQKFLLVIGGIEIFLPLSPVEAS